MEFSDFVIDLGAARRLATMEELRPELELARWLAIGVAGKAVVQKSWIDEAEVSEVLLQELVSSVAPTPNFDSNTRHRAVDEASRYAKPKRCGACAASPGRSLCVVCGGTGEVPRGQVVVDCLACEKGTLVCPACDGTRMSYDVRIAYHEDTPLSFAHVFVPENVHDLRAPMLAFVQRQSSIPSVLSINLKDDFAARDAYRGRRGDHEHEGHRFGGTLALARRYVERVAKSPSVVTSRYTALCWPFATFVHNPGTGFVVHADGNPGRL